MVLVHDRRTALRRASAVIALILVGTFLVSCGSSKSSSSNTLPPPSIAGPWEFIAVANNGSVTGVEVALTQAQVLVNGVSQATGQISASGPQIAFVSLTTVNGNANISKFGGSCSATATTNNGLGPGTVTGLGETVTFSYTANGSVFNVTATLSGDGTSIAGTYTAQTGNACSDNGGQITGTKVSKISGTYQGAMCPLGASSATCANSSNFSDTASGVASESGSTLTLTLNFTAGPDAGTNLTMSGPVTGNAFTVSGTYQGNAITYYGYYEQVYSLTVGASVPSLYLVNSSDASVSVGVLGVPQG